ncbi:MAG: LEPR-XLL domain-containing protein, partial [Chthoniobacteraceae bacterium]
MKFPDYRSKRDAQKKTKKSGPKAGQPAKPLEGRFALEAFEPRLMLDAQPLATLAGGALTVNTTDGNDSYVISRTSAGGGGGDIVKIKNVVTGTEETYGNATQGVTSIAADGKKGNDTFDLSALSTTTPVTITGGEGTNTIVAPGTTHVWNITAAGAGTVGQVTFTGVTNLTGGSGDDSYNFTGAGQLGSFFLDETAGGTDTVNLAASTVGVTLDLGKTGEQTVSTNLKLTLSAPDAFENVTGSAQVDTISGNAEDNTIIGGGGADILKGGLGDDTFVISGTTGSVSDEGGEDKIDFSALTADATVAKLADGTFTLTTGTDSLALDGIEKLAGGTGVNSLDFSLSATGVVVNLAGGYSTDFTELTGFTKVTGSGHDDTIIGSDQADVLIGGAGDDVIVGNAGADTIDGGTGIDRLVESRDVDFTLTDTSLADGTDTDTLTSIEAATLTGGASANTIDASAFSGDVTLDGGSTILLAALNGSAGVQTTDGSQFDLTLTTLLSSLNQKDGVR